MDQKIVGFNQFGAVIRKVKAWVESTFLTLSKDSADQSIAGVRSVSDIVKLAKGASQLTKITYSELKALRDGAKLVPGMQYRITDYTCTTTQEDTQSAGHVFDIIVTADDERTLNAKAGAMKHEGDTYFAKSDSAKWQIWYDLNNDKTKYDWADEVNGKGVIYRMVDEYGNDCPYDFKNIQFKRWKVISSDQNLNEKYIGCRGLNINGITIPNENDFKWFYTFSFVNSDSTIKDTSAINPEETYKNYAGYNIIKCFINPTNSIKLNNIVISDNVQDNTKLSCQNYFEVGCANNTFRPGCTNNKFGDSCTNNKFGDRCTNNTFGSGCTNNKFGNYCSGNGLGIGCTNNKFSDRCTNNKFGNYCSGNDLGDSCSGNGLGIGCTNNKFGDSCTNNTFGSGCTKNIFGRANNNNIFKNNCTNNTFGNNCQNNSFGNNYQNNSFGDNCQKITSGEIGTPIDYIRYVDIASGVSYIKFKSTTSTSKSNYLQNITLRKGITGTNAAPLVINVDVLNQDYEITYAKAADGTLVKQIAQA